MRNTIIIVLSPKSQMCNFGRDICVSTVPKLHLKVTAYTLQLRSQISRLKGSFRPSVTKSWVNGTRSRSRALKLTMAVMQRKKEIGTWKDSLIRIHLHSALPSRHLAYHNALYFMRQNNRYKIWLRVMYVSLNIAIS